MENMMKMKKEARKMFMADPEDLSRNEYRKLVQSARSFEAKVRAELASATGEYREWLVQLKADLGELK